MNLSPQWVPFFASHGISASHWSALGPHSAADSEILGYARRHQFVIFTHDLDFGMLLAGDVLPSAIGETIIRAIEESRSHLESGALMTIDRERQRIRLLPI